MSTYGREGRIVGGHSEQPISEFTDAILHAATRSIKVTNNGTAYSLRLIGYDVEAKFVGGMRDFYLFNDRSRDMKVVKELSRRGYECNTNENFEKHTITFHNIRPMDP